MILILIELAQTLPSPMDVEWNSLNSVFGFVVALLLAALYWLALDRNRIIKALGEEQVWSRNIGEKSVEYITKVESSFTTMHSIKETAEDTNRLAREIKQEVTRHGG